jgi:HAD superfamily hydrolase (TIGR01509 family)
MLGCGVGFDIDHTLAIDNKLERIALLRLLPAIDAAGGGALGTLDQETSAIDLLLERQRGGAFSIDEAVRRFVFERGIANPHPLVEQFRSIALSLVEHVVVPIAGVPRLLAELRVRGLAAAVLSNGWSPLQQRKAERAGFDGPVLASADIGVSKPHPQAFGALVQRLALPADCVWYVGDNPRTDVAAAKHAGLRAIWYNAEGRNYPNELTPPDATVTNVCDVLEIVTGTTVAG